MSPEIILTLIKKIFKRGTVFFNAGCNEQMFSSKLWKQRFAQIVLLFSRKTQKPLNFDTLQFRKNDVTEAEG